MIGIVEVIITVVCSIVFKVLFNIYMNDEKERYTTPSNKLRSIRGYPFASFDVICDITNDFGKYYAKEALNKKSMICIIPVYGNYNKEYEDVNKFNDFVTRFVSFLKLTNGKVALSSENDFHSDDTGTSFGEDSEEEKEKEKDIQFIRSLIYNERSSITVCVVNYNNRLVAEKQLNKYLINKKNYISTIVNNLFLYRSDDCVRHGKENMSKNCDEKDMSTRNDINKEHMECNGFDDVSHSKNTHKHLLNTNEFYASTDNLEQFLNHLNMNHELLSRLYFHINIHMTNFSYFYPFMEKSNGGTFFNIYIHGDSSFSNIYNPLIDIYHNLIFEKIQKDRKKIKVKKFYAFVNTECNHKKIVTLALNKLENNFPIINAYYRLYEFLYFHFILQTCKRKGTESLTL